MQEKRDPTCSLLLMQRIYSEAWKPHQRQTVGFGENYKGRQKQINSKKYCQGQ